MSLKGYFSAVLVKISHSLCLQGTGTSGLITSGYCLGHTLCVWLVRNINKHKLSVAWSESTGEK